MTPPAVMSAEEARAWLAGAQAARAADVAEVRRLAGGHSAAVRWYCAETTAASPEWSERADYESRASATLQGAGDALAALPLPPPPQTAPAPPQSPLPSPDGGTGPQGDGAPAGGLSVAAGDGPTVEVWRVVWEDDGREPASPWPVEVWRHGDGWAARDLLSATRPVGDTPAQLALEASLQPYTMVGSLCSTR